VNTNTGTMTESPAQAEEVAVLAATDYLKAVAHTNFREPVETEVIEGEDVTKVILDLARREQVDVIAMATHGRTGLSRILAGSVAGTVVRTGEIPVMLVRPTSRE
jgi:nucleotide-binding universal stress UspA family protein